MPLLKKIIALSFRYHRNIVANSKASLAAFGMKDTGENRFIIRNGVCAGPHDVLSKETARNECRLPPDAFIVSMVASLSDKKDHTAFLQAARQCLAEAPEMLFLVIGDGLLKNKLVRTAEDLNIAGRVIFTGELRPVWKYFAASDLSVLVSPPAQSEGGSNSIMEALACGVPVIATDAGNNPELIKDNFNGFLIKCGDINVLSEKILCLHKNRKKLEEMSAASLRSSDRKSLNASMALNYEKLYKALIRIR